MTHELLDRVAAIRPLLLAEAEAGEARGYPSKEVVDAVAAYGGWHLLVPERWGGGGLSLSEFVQVQIALARADPSIAWLSHILNSSTWTATLTADPIQEALFAHGPALVAGAYNPPGVAERVAGGYRVTGSFPYSSGCRQADWYLCGARIGGEGPLVIFYADIADARIEQSWHVTGLQGTGSDTCHFDGAYVPDARMIDPATPLGASIPGRRLHGAPSDLWPMIATIRTLCAAILVGTGEEMLDRVADAAPRRGIATTGYARQADSEVFRHHLGESAAKIAAARLVIEDACRRIDGHAAAGEPVPPARTAANKGSVAVATELALGAIDRLMTIAGSSAHARANPLQRYWRDAHMAASHATLLPHVAFEVAGRVRLGVEREAAPPSGY